MVFKVTCNEYKNVGGTKPEVNSCDGWVIIIMGERDVRFDLILGFRVRGVANPCLGSWNSCFF